MSSAKVILREKKTLLIISLLLLGVIVLTFLETYLQGVQMTSRFITNNIIVFAVVNINIILLMILVLLVLRNLVKLYFEHRQKIPGSKFKTKLIVAFTALSIIPAIILFIVSLTFINKSIQNWFEIRVEEVLKGTSEISKTYYQNSTRDLLHYAGTVSRNVSENRFLNPRKRDELVSFINAKKEEYNLESIEVFDSNLRLVFSTASFWTSMQDIPGPLYKSLEQALQGTETSLVEPVGKGDIIRSMVPVPAAGRPGHIEGVLTVNASVPASIAGQVENITATYENYRQSKILKNPIRISYQMTLGMITLLIIFSATWFAFYLARFITVPIQQMAEGTRRISEGDLDFTIELESKDELGMLINSFNNMTKDLKANKIKLEAAYRRLERSNLELEGRKLYIETVLDSIATGVISLDWKGRLTTINKAAQSMLGIRASKSLMRAYHKIFYDSSYEGIKSFIDDLHHRSINWLERKIDLAQEETLLNLLLIGSNLYDEKKKYSGTVIVLENLTELINAQRIAAWREVARRIAHEIKNPLTPIKLSAQRLRKKFFQDSGDFDNVFDEGTNMIISQVEELKKLVDEFSRFARMPSSKPVPADIHAVLDNTLKLYLETYKGMTFNISFHPEPLVAMLDPEQMKRAFVNIIDNSIEATEGAGTITVETIFDANSHSIRILFKDDGKGVLPEIRDKLFVPYFSTKKEGTGLGLTIVSSIVTDHRGYIRVKNNTPHGTIFIIELPALKGTRIKA